MENIKEYFVLRDGQLFLGSKGDIKDKDNIIYGGEFETNNICLIDKDRNIVRALVKKCLAKMGLDIDSKMIKIILMFQLLIIFGIVFISYLVMSKTSNIVGIIENKVVSENVVVKKEIPNKIYIDNDIDETPKNEVQKILDETLNLNDKK